MRVAGMIPYSICLAGACVLAVPASPPGRAAPSLPGNVTPKRVDFERHVMGLLGRAGCNAGSCHGSFQGRGGFRLSLFGHEPADDYQALARDALGRRVNPLDPDGSLLLLKATGQVGHGGGVRFGKETWQYALLREWIAAGAPWEKGAGTVQALRVTPAEHVFERTGAKVPLRVEATYANGDVADVTPFCTFRSNDDAVAEVSPSGEVSAVRPGSTAVVVSYRGHLTSACVLAAREVPAGFRYPETPAANYIDTLVFDRLRQLRIVPSELAGDEEFLRRVSIDTIGSLPTPDEVRAYLASRDPAKRAKKIDELLAHPRHAALWATRWCDITGNDTTKLPTVGGLSRRMHVRRSQMWYEWLRKRFAENVPYDQLVHGILCAASRDGADPASWLDRVKAIDAAAAAGPDYRPYAERRTLDLFWQRRDLSAEQWGEKTAAAFLGIRLECAQCHKHPFDRWTQAEYRAYASVFSGVGVGASPQSREVVEESRRRPGARRLSLGEIFDAGEVYFGPATRELLHPRTNQPPPPRAPGGPEIAPRPGEDPREALFRWMRAPDNPYFARSFVNRVWAHYFGVGLVHPVDDFSLANPPGNAKLLDALAQDFITSGFDIRHLERRILNARVYQLSSRTNATNKQDRNNFARGYVRQRLAEVALDVLNDALGAEEHFGPEVRPGSRAVEIGASVNFWNQDVNHVFRTFGRPARMSACDCERLAEPILAHTLYVMTDASILAKIRAPGGRLHRLLRDKTSDDAVLEELFLATLSRFPTSGDRAQFAAHRLRAAGRTEAFAGLLWALVNTREFQLNH
jgi:hypothetical protein